MIRQEFREHKTATKKIQHPSHLELDTTTNSPTASTDSEESGADVPEASDAAFDSIIDALTTAPDKSGHSKILRRLD